MREPTEVGVGVLDARTTRSETPVVLCIDDDPRMVEIIQDYLDHFKVDVLPAYFGAQGIWLAEVHRPDVIITDLRMPQGDGTTVIETLRRCSKTSSIPIIVLTCMSASDVDVHVQELGAANCLHKPLNMHDLLDELRRYIEVEPKAR